VNALHDVAAPVLGSFIYLWFRAWRDERRARKQGEVLPPRGSADGSHSGDMPVVGSSRTSDTPTIDP
jgi:hypothetical protein